ncbi:hypothetical protein SAMN05428949_3741 [Chitinophaga sp. YR627]|nr:hypothetical protein SAMN05428949_3741 [Chitinophaga sp. YR627]
MNKIALKEPGTGLSRKYFSVIIKNKLESEYALFSEVKKMMIVADTTGNFHSFKKKLLDKGVIDKKNTWIFSNGHLIVVGNFEDYRNVGNELLWMVYSLEQKAMKHGGYVHFILGAQGIKNLWLNWTFSTPNYAYPIIGKKKNYALLYDGNLELHRWLLTKNIIEKIGRVLINGGFYHNIQSDDYSSGVNMSAYKAFTKNAQTNIKKEDAPAAESHNSAPLILIKKEQPKNHSAKPDLPQEKTEDEYITINLLTHETCTLMLSRTHIRIGFAEKKEEISL